jgi:galactonate dehydratase
VLHFLPLTPLMAASGADRGAASITVTGLEVHRVRVNARGNWILTRITTSAGISGIGDASHGGPDDAKLTLLRQFFELLKGRSIYDVEWLRRTAEPEVLRRGSVAAVALSGLEQCLWDIRGKIFSVPTYELFGGRLHSRIRNYANIPDPLPASGLRHHPE